MARIDSGSIRRPTIDSMKARVGLRVAIFRKSMIWGTISESVTDRISATSAESPGT